MARNRRVRDPRARQRAARLAPPEKVIEELWNSIIDIWETVSPFVITVTTDYTTSGKVAVEEVECNNTSAITVTLHANPRNRDIVIVSRINTGGVTIATAGSETINGSSTLTILSQYDTPNLIFREDQNEWRVF